MPQSGQIIPSHLFPYREVVVNDNTEYTEVLNTTSDDSIKLLFVFASPKGPDNKIKTITGGLSQFIDTFGQGPFSLYGQPYLNAFNAFSTGNVVGHCLRVTADNATYAYSVLVALYKIDESNKMTVKFKTREVEGTLTDLNNMDELYTAPTEPIDDESPDNGFTEVKIMTVAAKGKGSYGKKLLYGITSDTGSDKENEYKNYVFTEYENFDSLKARKSHMVCFSEDAIVDNNSLFIDGVVNDPDNGSPRLQVLTDLDGIAKLVNAYKDANTESTLTVDDFDIFLGVNKYTRKAIVNYEIDTTSADVVVVNGVGGIALTGGEDGDLAESIEAATRQASLDGQYLKAFTGQIDPYIKSKNMYPVHLILDANYSKEVKQALAALVEARKDCMGIIDCGTGIKTLQSPLTYVSTNLDSYVRNRNEMIDAICGKVRDPYSKKLVTVTDTCILAASYPNNWAEHNGKHVPLAGNNYGVLNGFVKGSIYPVYDEDLNADIMDELCEERINFARLNAKQQIIRATQTTRQMKSSKLSEANNVFILLDIKRDCEIMCAEYEYNFAEASDIARFNTDAKTILDKYADSQVRSIEASFDKNDWEADRGILHLYVGYVNKDIVKTSIIEIDVNRGASASSEE